MKPFILLNPEKIFEKLFIEACKTRQIVYRITKTTNIIIDIHTNHIDFYDNGSPLCFDDAGYIFIRKKGKEILGEFATIICEYIDFKKIPYNDQVNLHDTTNKGKAAQMTIFGSAGLPVPHSIVCDQRGYIPHKKTILSLIQFPCVLKTRGAKGENVWKINNESELTKKIESLAGAILIQEYIPNNYDVRVLVFEDMCIGAIKRTSIDGFYNNVSKGATTEPIEITDHEKNISIRAAQAYNIDFGGVDFIRTPTGPQLLEVNKSPQIKGFFAATQIDVPAILIDSITKRYLSK
ncbi:MAG: ATP-grasp domain-containing protein [bacterium]